MTITVCFVCLGNICRSPTAEGVMRHVVNKAGLSDRFLIDSAGTAAYHAGEPPDRRSAAAAKRRGIILSGSARQFVASDLERFEHVLAMDRDNLGNLRKLVRSPALGERIRLFREYDPHVSEPADVPDPYYGGDAGFEEVLDICERSCQALLAELVPEALTTQEG